MRTGIRLVALLVLAAVALAAPAGCSSWGGGWLAGRLHQLQSDRGWMLLTVRANEVRQVVLPSGAEHLFLRFPETHHIRGVPWPRRTYIVTVAYNTQRNLLAYVWRTADPPGSELTVLDLDSLRRRVVLREDEVHGLAWSRSGASLALLGADSESVRRGRPATLYVYDLDADRLRVLSDRALIRSAHPEQTPAPWWSDGDKALWITSDDGRVARVRVADGFTWRGPEVDRTLWGSDRHILYVTHIDVGRKQAVVYLALRDGSQPVEVYRSEGADLAGVTISPDARFVFIADRNSPKGAACCVTDLETFTRVYFPLGPRWVHWARDFRGPVPTEAPEIDLFNGSAQER